jgi:DNA-directed RNA polymerase alpha subunit
MTYPYKYIEVWHREPPDPNAQHWAYGPLDNVPIEFLEISEPAYKALKGAGWYTIGGFRERPDSELLALRGIGPGRVFEIRCAVESVQFDIECDKRELPWRPLPKWDREG